MNEKILLSLLTSAMVVTSTVNPASAQEVVNVKKYSVDVSDELRVAYNGDNNELFPKGLKQGLGLPLLSKDSMKTMNLNFMH